MYLPTVLKTFLQKSARMAPPSAKILKILWGGDAPRPPYRDESRHCCLRQVNPTTDTLKQKFYLDSNDLQAG